MSFIDTAIEILEYSKIQQLKDTLNGKTEYAPGISKRYSSSPKQVSKCKWCGTKYPESQCKNCGGPNQ